MSIAKIGEIVKYDETINVNIYPFVYMNHIRKDMKRKLKHGKFYDIVDVCIDYSDIKDNNWYRFKDMDVNDWYPCVSFLLDPRLNLIREYGLR